MPRLVAIDLAGGSQFVDELTRAWDDGDAVLPLDQRISQAARVDLVSRFGAAVVVGPHGRTSVGSGEPVEPGDALVVATSGSTGEPKGVVLTHRALAASAEATSSRLGVTSDDHWLACLPLSHVGGLSVVTRAILTGTRLSVLPRFDPEAVERSPATLVSLVPTALSRIDPDRFRMIVVGGSRPPAVRPPNVVTTYGMTETGSGVVYDRYPLSDVEIRVVDGEIHVRCPMLMRCYRDGTDPRTPDGWFPTGDLGSLSGDGELTVHGRRGDMIITGGENVWPEPVEDAVRSLPGVVDVAVVGIADPEWGQRVVAVVVPTDPSRPVTLDEVRRVTKATLAPYCAPRQLEFVDALPRTALGKLRRGRVAAGLRLDHRPDGSNR